MSWMNVIDNDCDADEDDVDDDEIIIVRCDDDNISKIMLFQ